MQRGFLHLAHRAQPLVPSSHAFHQLFVQLADQADTKGEFPEAEDTVLECHHIISYLS